jgi:SAM-dependent methyltransferase
LSGGVAVAGKRQRNHNATSARSDEMRPNRLHVAKSSCEPRVRVGHAEAHGPVRSPPRQNAWVRRALHRAWFGLSRRFRARRAALFRREFELGEETRVLDLGGGDGEHIRMVLRNAPVRPENVYVADVNERALERARAHGYRTALLPQDGQLPFPDGFFDIVFCSSVIEHVTVPKNAVWQYRDERFGREAIVHQRAFADEISRIAKSFWVQTPARSFLLETHSWLPFFGWLPRSVQVAILGCTRHFWVSRHPPDYYLLTRGHMEALFPGARIQRERWLGMTKSWIAVRRT